MTMSRCCFHDFPHTLVQCVAWAYPPFGYPGVRLPAMGSTRDTAFPPAADVELIAGDANREPNREAGR